MIYPAVIPVEVQVLQDRDLVLTELFQEEWLAVNWARAYEERLKQQGWHDSSELSEQGRSRDPQQERSN